MSEYQRAAESLNSCIECNGTGEVDDAEPGDISFNTYQCGYCKGTGFVGGEVY